MRPTYISFQAVTSALFPHDKIVASEIPVMLMRRLKNAGLQYISKNIYPPLPVCQLPFKWSGELANLLLH
jgi:hypothetical protein